MPGGLAQRSSTESVVSSAAAADRASQLMLIDRQPIDVADELVEIGFEPVREVLEDRGDVFTFCALIAIATGSATS